MSRSQPVLLRPATPADASIVATLVAGVDSDSSGAASRPGSPMLDPEELARSFQRAPDQHLAVTHGEDILGLVEWRWVGQPEARCADLGLTIGVTATWNTGVGLRATEAMLDLLFITHYAHRVQFQVALSNVRMIKTLVRKYGPVLEGIKREAIYLDGCYDDLTVWSILRHEYDAVTRNPAEDAVAVGSARATPAVTPVLAGGAPAEGTVGREQQRSALIKEGRDAVRAFVERWHDTTIHQLIGQAVNMSNPTPWAGPEAGMPAEFPRYERGSGG